MGKKVFHMSLKNYKMVKNRGKNYRFLKFQWIKFLQGGGMMKPYSWKVPIIFTSMHCKYKKLNVFVKLSVKVLENSVAQPHLLMIITNYIFTIEGGGHCVGEKKLFSIKRDFDINVAFLIELLCQAGVFLIQ